MLPGRESVQCMPRSTLQLRLSNLFRKSCIFLQPDDALGQQQRSGLSSFMQAPDKSEQSSGLAAKLWALRWAKIYRNTFFFFLCYSRKCASFSVHSFALSQQSCWTILSTKLNCLVASPQLSLCTDISLPFPFNCASSSSCIQGKKRRKSELTQRRKMLPGAKRRSSNLTMKEQEKAALSLQQLHKRDKLAVIKMDHRCQQDCSQHLPR